MLNAMFREFQRLLNENGSYGLFNEFNTQPWRVPEWREKYENLGVLYVVNGNLNKIPDGAMMEISYVLELFLKVPDTITVSNPIVVPLENLATGTTGVIYTETGSSAQYFLNTSLPTSDGALIEGEDCNYVRYQLSIAVTFTNGVALSDNSKIVFTINGQQYPALKGVLTFTEAPQTQVETNVFVEADGDFPAMQNESLVSATGWNAQISKLFFPSETVDVALRSLILTNPRQQVTVSYQANGDTQAITRTVILHDCVFTNELGQPSYFVINMSTGMRAV